jgi:hypothetical protein
MTNNVIAERLERAWLKVNQVSKVDHTLVVRGYLFDDTPFDFAIPDHQLESMGDGNPGLVEVGCIGDKGSFSEIVLPAPVLNYGHTVRVKPDSLVRWQEITKVRELAKKFQEEKK